MKKSFLAWAAILQLATAAVGIASPASASTTAVYTAHDTGGDNS